MNPTNLIKRHAIPPPPLHTPHTPSDPPPPYAIILDAGSSGTRIQIYNLTASTTDYLPLVQHVRNPVQNKFHLKTEPGLSSFAHNVGSLDGYFDPLIDFAKQTIPAAMVHRTPIQVLATAGMRLLSLQDQGVIVDAVCGIVETSGFLVHPLGCHQHSVRVISGLDEGLFGWAAVNYMAGTLRYNATVGFLDMGGASTQVAFASQTSHNAARTLYLPHNNTTEPVHVHVTSFLGLGINEAFKTHFNLLASTTHSNTPEPVAVVDDPCLPVGISRVFNLRMGSVVLHASSPSSTDEILVKGTGNWDACHQLTQSQLLVEHGGCIHGSPCLLPIPISNMLFVGVSEYFYSTHDLFGLAGAYVPELIKETASRYCGLPWPSELHQYTLDHGVHLDRLQQQCFKSAWISTILHFGLGVPTISLPATSPATSPPISTELRICQVPDNQIPSALLNDTDVPAHIKKGSDLFTSFKKGNQPTADVPCTQADIRIVTADRIDHQQISWTLGSLLVDYMDGSMQEPVHTVPPHSSMTAASQIISVFSIMMAGFFLILWLFRKNGRVLLRTSYSPRFSGLASSPDVDVVQSTSRLFSFGFVRFAMRKLRYWEWNHKQVAMDDDVELSRVFDDTLASVCDVVPLVSSGVSDEDPPPLSNIQLTTARSPYNPATSTASSRLRHFPAS